MQTDQRHRIIAIDGPAASGKSSVSRILSERLGFIHVNSGEMYRAVTWSVLKNSIPPDDADAVVEHLHTLEIICGVDGGEGTLTINGVDPGDELRSQAVNDSVSAVSAIPEVRDSLVRKQRGYQELGDIVMEGRDIGSVVFPNTPFKFYIDASPEVRAARRRGEGLADDLAKRDAIDSARKASPLVVPPDAVVIDTSVMDLEAVVSAVVDALRNRGMQIA